MPVMDLMGMKFERLIVLSRATNTPKNVRWNVRCDCGTEKVVYGRNLRRGATRSCGCLSREVTAARKTTHGATNRMRADAD
jgi:hypothetical protein